MEITIGLVLVLFLIWYAIGVASFIYYVTLEYDFNKSDIGFALLIGVGGLITSLAVFIIILTTYKIKNDTVLFKRRK